MRFAPDWGADPIVSNKFDRNNIEIPRYASIERRFSGQAQGIISAYQSGDLTRLQAMTQFKEALQSAENEAFVAGRRARGVASFEITDEEAAMLTGRHSRNMRYFGGFLRDIDGGKYDSGRNGPMTPAKRADLYARSLWSLYTRGEATDWAEPENQNKRYYWVMDPDAEHCKDCLDRARRSRDQDGFTWEELVAMGFPGEGTVCMVNCRCHIQAVGARSLVPRTSAEPADTPEEGVEELVTMLGGPGLKVTMPASGIPSVGLTPELLSQILRGFQNQDTMLEAARSLPLIPSVLAKPTVVADHGLDRFYGGQGMTLKVSRNDDGLWMLTGFLLGMSQVFWGDTGLFGLPFQLAERS